MPSTVVTFDCVVSIRVLGAPCTCTQRDGNNQNLRPDPKFRSRGAVPSQHIFMASRRINLYTSDQYQESEMQ